MKYRYILFTLLLIVSNINAQSISRKGVSTAGGTLTGGSSQITFSIGETVISSMSTATVILTQGFQQPGEQIKTGSVAANVCTGSTFSLSYTAVDIGGGNTFTAQLSNAAGSFASPVNIGTLSGNASTAVINVAIPANTAAGNGYRIRITSSSPAFIGTDNGTNIAISATLVAPTVVAQSFCSSATVASLPTGAGAYKWYSSPNGGTALSNVTVLNTKKYYVSTTSGSCESDRTAVNVTINTIPASPTVAAQSFCGPVTVAALPTGGGAYKWYAASGGGSALPNNTALSTNNYYVSTTSGSCESTRTPVSVTVNTAVQPVIADLSFCGPTTVASLPTGGGTYVWYKGANGAATLSSNTAVTTGDYYVSSRVGSCESQRTKVRITVGPSAIAGTINGAAQLCVGQLSSYTSTGTSGGSWSSTNTAVATVNATTGVVTPASTGNTTIKYTVNSACGVLISFKDVQVNALPIASITYNNTTFCKSGSINVTRTGQTGGSYSATPSGLDINGSTGKINLSKSLVGTYQVMYSFSNGSCSTVTSTTLNVSNCASKVMITDKDNPETTSVVIINPFEVIVYPNPSNHQFTFVVKSDSNETIDVVLYDVLGRRLKHIQKADEKTIVLGDDLPAGTYIAVVGQGTNKKSINLIKK